MPARQAPLFRRVALVGLGLLGSSLARAIARAGLAREIAVADRDGPSLARAEALGLGTSYHATAAEAACGRGRPPSSCPGVPKLCLTATACGAPAPLPV